MKLQSATPEIFCNESMRPYLCKTETLNTEGMAGSVRFDFNSQTFKVFDGSMWINFPDTNYTIGLMPKASQVLEWANKKMLEEQQLEERLNSHPGLRDAYEKFQILDALVTQENNNE